MHHLAAPRLRRAAAIAIAALLVVAAVSLAACTGPSGALDANNATAPVEIVLASTTSTEDSGLFTVLLPAFESDNPGIRVKVVAVGTGEALQLGRNKDVDVLLVHSTADEELFVAGGYGTGRMDVMYNEYVIVGPEGSQQFSGDVEDVFARLADTGVEFISRGDDSGTHKKERSLWAKAGVDPGTLAAYRETGQGMGETLRIASEKQAHTITDRATFLALQDTLDLDVVYEGPGLRNQYGVIVVEGALQQEAAGVFAGWVTSDAARNVIGEFGVEKYGQPLFVPNAVVKAQPR